MNSSNWRPTADISALKQRAALLQAARCFFAERQVLEVETPILSQCGSTETHLNQFVAGSQSEAENPDKPARRFLLSTSAELAMKRLLATGSGDIYQISKVFRAHEKGSRHQPEFTMLEWYRLGFTLDQMMQEVEELINTLAPAKTSEPAVTYTYREAFKQIAGLDPLSVSINDLRNCYRSHTGDEPPLLDDKQSYLDLVMSYVIEPAFNPQQITFVKFYPAQQASLARLCVDDANFAERFEAFAGGMELANGFHELTDVDEQRERMLAENQQRQQRGLPIMQPDERFLAALESGMPDCSGVALGFDRLCMLVMAKKRIDQVMSFTVDNC